MTLSGTQTTVLRILTEARGVSVSGQRISEALGLSRVSVAAAVNALRAAGYSIRSTPRVGHLLEGRSGRLLPFEVRDGLATRWAGQHVVHYDELDSTQAHAAGLDAREAPHGTLVIAEKQSSGRGRLGKSFWSPEGGLWCTLVLRSLLQADAVPLLGLAAGVAASIAIAETSGIQPLLKWPNDLLIDGAKVAGILIDVSAEEQVVNRALIGLGVNVNARREEFPEELTSTITSLREHAGVVLDRRPLLQRYLAEIEGLVSALEAGDTTSVVSAWESRPNMLGSVAQVERWGAPGIEGVAESLGADGSLLVRSAGGELIAVRSGSVHLLPDRMRAPGR